MNIKSIPPRSERELLERATEIAGYSLGQLAKIYLVKLPADLTRAKGWVGQFIEICLGAQAGCQAIPDFPDLGVELKTIPISKIGKPIESTYVCKVQLINGQGTEWCNSLVKAKLSRVLWIPIQADPNIPLPERMVGMPLLWSPNEQEEKMLRRDWEELMELVCLGGLDKIDARLGTYLQIRPKALNGKSVCWGNNEYGDKVLTLPRGFYLRASFTSQIIENFYL